MGCCPWRTVKLTGGNFQKVKRPVLFSKFLVLVVQVFKLVTRCCIQERHVPEWLNMRMSSLFNYPKMVGLFLCPGTPLGNTRQWMRTDPPIIEKRICSLVVNKCLTRFYIFICAPTTSHRPCQIEGWKIVSTNNWLCSGSMLIWG